MLFVFSEKVTLKRSECKWAISALTMSLKLFRICKAKMGNKITRRCTAVVDERYTRPQGLYPQRDVDQKKLRRLILDAKLAPCFPGEDEPNADFEECPICFLVRFFLFF